MEIRKRFWELYNISFQHNSYEFTDFLSIDELAELYEYKEIPDSAYTVFGGFTDAERCMVRFGNEDDNGYVEDFPIVCLEIKPLIVKFADALNHRDFLGALMNLGIKREVLGDIVVMDEKVNGSDKSCRAILFCRNVIADFIIDNLDKVKHTSVKVSKCQDISALIIKEPHEYEILAASERIDAVIASLYKISRTESKELFSLKKIYVNGRQVENADRSLSEGDRITVRGYGRFEYVGIFGHSKKGKLYIKIMM